jgi:PilZ domain
MSVKEFLSQPAVTIAVPGHYTLAKRFDAQGKPRSFACRTSRISPFRMMVMVPVVGRIGDPITSFFGDFGKLDGVISDTVNGGFLFDLAMSATMREKFASKLTWLEQKQKDPNIRDGRKQPRIVPASSQSFLTFADGSTRGCLIIDMSATGVALSADVQPEIGMPLAVGTCIGRVVRHLPDGFAVKFVEPQSRDVLERRVVRPAPPPYAAGTRAAPQSSHTASAA